MRSSALARSIDWERSRLSHHLGRMEVRHLIRRDTCDTDSRGAEVTLTTEGAHAFRRPTAPHMRSIKKHFADAFEPEQFEAITCILHSVPRPLHPYPATRP